MAANGFSQLSLHMTNTGEVGICAELRVMQCPIQTEPTCIHIGDLTCPRPYWSGASRTALEVKCTTGAWKTRTCSFVHVAAYFVLECIFYIFSHIKFLCHPAYPGGGAGNIFRPILHFLKKNHIKNASVHMMHIIWHILHICIRKRGVSIWNRGVSIWNKVPIKFCIFCIFCILFI